MTLRGHSGEVMDMQIHPDNTLLGYLLLISLNLSTKHSDMRDANVLSYLMIVVVFDQFQNLYA